MANYIDIDYLAEVLGERALSKLLAERREDSIVALDDAGNIAAMNRAIASAEGIADSKLGRRFSLVELEQLGQDEAVRCAIARIAAYELAPSSMGRSEEMINDRKIQCAFLAEVGSGAAATGRADPSPPPDHSRTIHSVRARGLDKIRCI